MSRLLLGLLLCLNLGCGGSKIPPEVLASLDNAQTFELISLEPPKSLEESKRKTGGERLYGNLVLGKTTINDKETQLLLIKALKKGAAENSGDRAMCFNPRHGIRVLHEGKTVEVLICFECLQVMYIIDGNDGAFFLTTQSPQPVFDKVLKDAGITLAKPPYQ